MTPSGKAPYMRSDFYRSIAPLVRFTADVRAELRDGDRSVIRLPSER